MTHTALHWLALLPLLQATLGAATNDSWNVGPSRTFVDQPNVLPDAPVLVKSLGDAAERVRRWTLPPDPGAWQRRRSDVDLAFRRAIGLENLPPRSPLNARSFGRLDGDGCTIEKIVFESRPGFPVTANLYRPTTPGPSRRPAIVSPIGHFLSAGKTATDVQARCIGLAHRGFVVLAYDAIGQGERMFTGNIHHEAGYALLPLGETIAGWMVWDSMRAIDFLETLPDIDPARIGITGNSGGGLNTLFTTALDPRIRAAVVVGFTFEFNHWIKYGGTHCTCTHLPGLVDSMEWFEIAGLAGPRPLLMIQGENDAIFPVIGARNAGHATESLYRLTGSPGLARFTELEGQPHAYTRPFREVMYGWMSRHLLGSDSDAPSLESASPTLPEKDPRLLCDPDARFMPQAPTVVDLARSTARRRVSQLPSPASPDHAATVSNWVARLVAPTDTPTGFLGQRAVRPADPKAGQPERFSFLSEPGVWIPGLLWLPHKTPPPFPVVLVTDSQGKAHVAESNLAPPLVEAGYAVMAVDLRGRGETLGRYNARHDINFRLVANQILAGQPLAGRRAFDLHRAVDLIGRRTDLDVHRITGVGLGDDALPLILAAANDSRIRGIAIGGFLHSITSAMKARRPPHFSEMGNAWNDPQLDGRIDSGTLTVEFGSVIPSMLAIADIPDLIALLSPRPLLACQFRDITDPGVAEMAVRFRDTLRSPVANQTEYSPEAPFNAQLLLAWLSRSTL